MRVLKKRVGVGGEGSSAAELDGGTGVEDCFGGAERRCGEGSVALGDRRLRRFRSAVALRLLMSSS